MTDTPPPPTRATSLALKDAKTIGQALQSAELLERIRAGTPRHMSPDRMLRTFVQAVSQTPALARCDMRSLVGAMLSCSQLGLEPNTPQGHAYLIPFDRRNYNKETRKWEVIGTTVQLILGYKGLLDLAFRSGQVASIHCDVVMPGDHHDPGTWSYSYGSDGHLHHRPAGIDPPGTTPTHAYMHARLKLGEAYEVMPWASVLAIRNGSQGYRAALAARDRAAEAGRALPAAWTEAPWVKYEIPMARKTALRAGAKWMPSSIELSAAVSMDETQDRRTLDFGLVYDGHATVLEGLPESRDPDPDSDAGGAFGMRGASAPSDGSATPEPEPVPLDDEQPAPARTAAAPASRQPAPRNDASTPAGPQREAAPGFSAELLDGDGMPAVDYGTSGSIADPRAWATAYAALWRSTPPDLRDALAEHNADALQEAFMASTDAASILNALSDPAPAEPEPVAPTLSVPLVATSGRPDVKGYLAALRTAAEQQGREEFPAWSAAQAATIDGLAPVTRGQARKIIEARAAMLAGHANPAPDSAGDAGQPSPDPAPPTSDAAAGGTTARAWSESALWIIQQLDKCQTGDDVGALASNGAVVRKMDALAPDERDAVNAYGRARKAALTGRGAP